MKRLLRDHWIWIVAPLVLGAAAIVVYEVALRPDSVCWAYTLD